MLRAVPPAPVASLSPEQRLVGSRELFGCRSSRKAFGRILGLLTVEIARTPQMFPRHHVLARTDPDIEIGVDPRRRKNAVVGGNFSCRGNRFACRQGTNIRIVVNPAVKLPQKFAAVAVVILPRIFAIENQ